MWHWSYPVKRCDVATAHIGQEKLIIGPKNDIFNTNFMCNKEAEAEAEAPWQKKLNIDD